MTSPATSGLASTPASREGDQAAPALPAAAITLIHRPPSIVERLDLAGLFPKVQPLEVELGSGDGSFLAHYAQAHPERNFIGVERLLGRLRKLDRKGLRAGLRHLRLVRIEAAYFLEYLLPRNCLEALHIYFPDPWPKRRHWKNRLVNERFPDLAAAVLKPGGVIYLRTDNEEYYAQMLRVLGASPTWVAIDTPVALSGQWTDFERAFQARGIPTLRAAYQRRPA